MAATRYCTFRKGVGSSRQMAVCWPRVVEPHRMAIGSGHRATPRHAIGPKGLVPRARSGRWMLYTPRVQGVPQVYTGLAKRDHPSSGPIAKLHS